MRYAIVLAPLLAMLLPAQQPQQPPTYRAGAEEVVIDVIVRDKKGKPIKDLTAADFKVSDNGVEQKILGMRMVEGAEAIERGTKVPLDAMRQIRLVTLVFEQLEGSDRQNAKRAALDLVKGTQAQNVFYSVVAITTQLNVLQPFTTDKQLLQKAIEKATSGKYPTFTAESDRIKAQLREIAGRAGSPAGQAAPAAPAAQGAAQTAAAATAAGAAAGAAYIEKRTAEIMLEMLSFDASYGRNEGSRLSIFSLLSLVRGQYSMPGRKSILYFTWGMYVPPHLDEPFRNIMSAANRGNISFYSVDTRGVTTWSQNQGAREQLSSATRDIASDTTRTEGAVTIGQVMAGDRAETSGRSNTQMPIRDLAESTGGFLIADANDLRPALQKVNEDINSYYEITYNPGITSYDGAFHRTRVESVREDLVIQARNGYFALPLNVRGPAVLPYEFALLKALDTTPAPADVAFRSAALRVKPDKDGEQAMVLVEVPMSGVKFTEDAASKTFRMRLSLVALLKNEKGEVVQTFSHDLPRSGALTLLPQARGGNFFYKEQAQVAPGRYTLEAAVLDHEANKIGVEKTALVVEAAPAGVRMSSLYLVRAFTPNLKDVDPNDPMKFQTGRITPTLGGKVFAVPGAQLSTFFVVYPDPSVKTPPVANIEFLVGGAPVAKADLQLPAPDPDGRIPYVMSAPADKMPPADYEIHVTVTQGNTKAEDRMKVTVAPRE